MTTGRGDDYGRDALQHLPVVAAENYIFRKPPTKEKVMGIHTLETKEKNKKSCYVR